MRSFTRPFSLFVFWIALLSGSLPAPAQEHSAPLEVLRSGHIAVQVRVNGKGPFRLILDTGSPVTFITPRAAREAGVIAPAEEKEPQTPAALMMGGQTTLKSLSIGDTEVKDLNVLIFNHPTVDAMSGLVGRLDGIVGFSFFSRFHTTIDYLNGRVAFEPVAYTPQDVMSGMMNRLLSPPPARVIAPRTLWGLIVSATPQNTGVTVTKVYPSSAAAAAGFRAGDRITLLDDRWTDTVNDLYEAASLVNVKQPITVKVMRGDKETVLTVRPRPGI